MASMSMRLGAFEGGDGAGVVVEGFEEHGDGGAVLREERVGLSELLIAASLRRGAR